MVEPDAMPNPNRRLPFIRMAAALGAVVVFGLGIYILLEVTRPETGLVGFSFLLILPAVISAFVSYIADPWRERSLRFYLMIPLWILLAVTLVSIILLREGVICVLLLSPLWVVSGLIGAGITYKMRHRIDNGKAYCSLLLAMPLLAIQVEPYIPLPSTFYTVSREVIVNAPPDKIWPLLKGIPDVGEGEGKWNISQNLIGVPRPIGAHLEGEGIGADRFSNWGAQVKFRERITEWDIGRRIGWRFIFDDIDGWKFTDRHLMPDSPYFCVTEGGYTLIPISKTKTRLVIDTSYWIRTPVNSYSSIWGQLFLGDLENNLLALVKHRAEGKEQNYTKVPRMKS